MSDTEKAALERRIDELCAEVEALKRDEWAAGFSAGCDAVEAAYEDGMPYYEVENAKLRELLSEIAKLVTNPYGGCLRPGCAHGCPHHLECDEELHTCFYVDRMRELGIEVDE